MAYHVIPLNDLKEHTEDSTCECQPELIMVENEMLFVHNAWDNRELIEELNEELDE